MEATRLFIEQIANKCEIDEGKSRDLCTSVFQSIASRLGYSSGIQFAMQLPYGFQRELLKNPVGPDRSVTAQKMVGDVADILVVPHEGARNYIQEVWDLLNQYADRTQLLNCLQRLPADIAELFELPEPRQRHDHQQWLSC